MLIIPDIHGRTFWKDAVKQFPDEKVIFLGDYLDPYDREMRDGEITKKSAIDNFMDIIEFKIANYDRVTLLLGNHDFMTYIYPEMGDCRTDFQNRYLISDIYEKNKELFKLATYVDIDNKLYTFSHGAILKKWVSSNQKILQVDIDDPKAVIDKINEMYTNNDEQLCSLLNQVSPYRTWLGRTPGSIVWADVREMPEGEPEWENCYEIFGHTLLNEDPIITEHYADLDIRRAFIFTDKGEIKELDDILNN